MNKHSSVPSVLLTHIEVILGGIISVEDAVKLTQAFAKGVGKEAPIDYVREDPFISPEDVLKEKYDARRKNKYLWCKRYDDYNEALEYARSLIGKK